MGTIYCFECYRILDIDLFLSVLLICNWNKSTKVPSYKLASIGFYCSLFYRLFWVCEILIGFQDVVFLRSCAGISSTFPKNYGKCERLGSTTCHKTVVDGRKSMLSVKYFCSNKSCHVSVSVEFCGDHKTVTNLR